MIENKHMKTWFATYIKYSSRTCLAQFGLVALCNDVTLQWIPAFHFEEVHCNTKAPAVTETDNHDVDKGLI